MRRREILGHPNADDAAENRRRIKLDDDKVADLAALEAIPVSPVGLGRRRVRQFCRCRRRPHLDHGADAKFGIKRIDW